MFEDRAVAFLDILGFKQLIVEAEKAPSGLNKLLVLKTVLESHVKFDNSGLDSSVPVTVHPKYIFISDSIIFSAPLKSGKYDGLDIVVTKCIQVAQKVMEAGHLIRGGISVGKVWHEQGSNGSNIFGSGYIDAYLTEQSAKHPCILLSEPAAELWKNQSRSVPSLCVGDKKLMVDVLHAGYLPTNAAQLPFEEFFDPLRVHIEASLRNLQLGSDARAKWEWMAGFFNDALVRHEISTKRFSSLPLPD
ncbi:hypothetical protein [Bradyrhizobium sp. B039]|uniref:hypothetical protein n=1 Tax=Bradyrhizobium sp. B039 TaxID=3140239 RepID=UPI003182E715